MELEPCPICGNKTILHEEEFEGGNLYQTKDVHYVCCKSDFTDNWCSYRGPWDDPDGSKHNKLSLNARLGKMVVEKNLKVGGGPDQFWWYLKTYEEPAKRGLFNNIEDMIRDAWNKLY